MKLFKKSFKALYTIFKDTSLSLKLFKYLFNKNLNNIAIGNNKNIFFKEKYKERRKNRINFLVKLCGKDWFKDKKIIDFGSGNGEVSKFFFDIGANIICCEGRHELVRDIKKRNKNFKIIRFDNDSDWEGNFKEKQFDLAIHWGLLYHLKNWERDLINTLKIAKVICLESEVTYYDEELVYTRKEFGHDQALHNIGSFISSKKIENIFNDMNLKFKRYDSKKLNSINYKDDWNNSCEKESIYEYRRYWLVWNE